MNAKNTIIDYGKGCVLQIKSDSGDVIITLSKELTKKVKIVFKDTGIPGVVGSNLCVDAQEVANRYWEDFQCGSCSYSSRGLCDVFGGLVLGSERVGKCVHWKTGEKDVYFKDVKKEDK